MIVGPSYINKMNKIKVLDLVRSTEYISRADIAKTTKLSPPTITRIIDSLINNEQLVIDMGVGESLGGRPPNLVKFAGQDKYIIGIDLGRTNILGVITNLHAEIISEIKIPTFVEEGGTDIIGRVARVVQDLIHNSGINREKLFGVGLAIAGLINTRNHRVVYSTGFDWHNFDIEQELRKHIDLPVVFDNVTRVMALGELYLGAGSRYRNFVCLNIGYGIGTGIVINGEPYAGTHGFGGEFGHTVIDASSRVTCDCGNNGCLEALASGHGIAEAAKRRISQSEKSGLLERYRDDIDAVSAEMVFAAASCGDRLAGEVVDEAVRFIGLGVVNLINVFDPEAVIIGGGVSLAGDQLLKPVQKIVEEKSMSHHSKKQVYIALATYGTKASVMGAVSLVLNKVMTLDLLMQAHAE